MKKKEQKKKVKEISVEKILERLSSENQKDIKAAFGGRAKDGMMPVLYRDPAVTYN